MSSNVHIKEKAERYMGCRNCKDDIYDQSLKQCIQYIQTKRSARLLQLFRNQSDYLYKIQHKKVQQASKLFQIRVCPNGTPHLWKDVSKVLMVREAYEFVSDLHGYEHLNGEEMIRKAGEFRVHLPPIFSFIDEYPSFCNYCLSMRPINRPKGGISPLWGILENKFGLNLQSFEDEETAQQICKKLDVSECQNDLCSKDEYDRQNQICLYILKFRKFPALPRGQGSSPNRSRLKKKAEYMKIVQCKFKTDHLWMKESQMRIPMIKQAKQIARMLHGHRAHRCKKTMRQLVFGHQKRIYPHGLTSAIDQIVSQCLICNPKTADPIQDNDNNSEEEITHEAVRQKKKSKLPYARMGLQMKQQYTRQLMEKPEHRQKVMRVRQIISSMQIWEDPSSYLPRITAATGFFQVAAELAIDNLHWSRANDDILQQTLNRVKGVIYRAVKQGKTTKALFVCTEIMKYNYLKYGETVCIDYISGVTRRRQASGRHFIVGFITGQDHCGNLVIFGITMLSKQLSMYHLKSLELFYEVMGKQCLPKLLCIPDSKPLIMSLEILKRQKGLSFEYAINWFYVLQFLKKNSQQQLEKNTIIEMFCMAMSEPLTPVYRHIMQRIKSQIVNTNIYKQIEKLGQMFCISRLNKMFIGYGLSTYRVDKLYEVLEKQLMYQLKIGSFFNNVFKIDKKLCDQRISEPTAKHAEQLSVDKIKELLIKLEIQYRKSQMQMSQLNKYGENPKIGTVESVKLTQEQSQQINDILHVSQLIHQNIFNHLLRNFYFSLSQFLICDADCPYETKFIVKQKKQKNKCVFVCQYFVAHNYWKCNCDTIYITGLPCSHLIRVLAHTKGSLQYYINQRWIMSSNKQVLSTYTVEKIQSKIEDRVSDHLSERSKRTESALIKFLEPSQESKQIGRSNVNMPNPPVALDQHQSNFDSFSLASKCNSAIIQKGVLPSHSEISGNKSLAHNASGIGKYLPPPRNFQQLLKAQLQKIKHSQSQASEKQNVSNKQKSVSIKVEDNLPIIQQNQNSIGANLYNVKQEREGKNLLQASQIGSSNIVNFDNQSEFSVNRMSYNDGNLYQWSIQKRGNIREIVDNNQEREEYNQIKQEGGQQKYWDKAVESDKKSRGNIYDENMSMDIQDGEQKEGQKQKEKEKGKEKEKEDKKWAQLNFYVGNNGQQDHDRFDDI